MKKEYEQNETEIPCAAEPDVSGYMTTQSLSQPPTKKVKLEELERDCYTVEECRSRLLNLVRSHFGVR